MEHADTWQRRSATLLFADRDRMAAVRRRPPLSRRVDPTGRPATETVDYFADA